MEKEKEPIKIEGKVMAKLRKGRPGGKMQIPLFATTVLMLFLTVTMAILLYGREYRASYLIPFYTFLSVTLLCLLLLLIPKYFPKSWIDALNKDMYEKGYGIQPSKTYFPIDKSFLYTSGIENQYIERLEQDIEFATADGLLTVLTIGACREYPDMERSDSFIPFSGTVLILDSEKVDIDERLEIRERSEYITKSYLFNSKQTFPGEGRLQGFDICCNSKDKALAFLTEERTNAILEIQDENPGGVALIFKQNQIIVELFNEKSDVQPIIYKETKPWSVAERKKRSLSKLKRISELEEVFLKR